MKTKILCTEILDIFEQVEDEYCGTNIFLNQEDVKAPDVKNCRYNTQPNVVTIIFVVKMFDQNMQRLFITPGCCKN